MLHLGKAPQQQLFQVLRGDHRHVHNHEPGHQGLVQLPGAGVAVVHGGDEAGGVVEGDPLVAGHVDGPAEVQRGMEHRQRLVLGHVDLVQHAEAAHLRTLVDGALPQRHGAVFKGVRAQQGGGVRVDVEGHVPAGAAEHGGQVFRQHVLAGGLGAHQQQVLPAQQSRQGLFPDLLAVIEIAGLRNPAAQALFRGEAAPESFYFLYNCGIDSFLPQIVQHVQHCGTLR